MKEQGRAAEQSEVTGGKSGDEQKLQPGGFAAKSTSGAGMLQKQVTSKRGGSKAPPPMANLSLVLQRPLVRPSQAEKKGGKVKLQARSGNNLQASSSKNLQASSSKNLQAVANKKLQASSSNLQTKSNKKINVQRLSKATSSLDNHGRQLQGKENGNFFKN